MLTYANVRPGDMTVSGEITYLVLSNVIEVHAVTPSVVTPRADLPHRIHTITYLCRHIGGVIIIDQITGMPTRRWLQGSEQIVARFE